MAHTLFLSAADPAIVKTITIVSSLLLIGVIAWGLFFKETGPMVPHRK